MQIFQHSCFIPAFANSMSLAINQIENLKYYYTAWNIFFISH